MPAPGSLLFTGVVHPWLCDNMGHLTTRHYLAMFDEATYRMLYEAFGYVATAGEYQGLGWADVRHVIEYKNEARAGALLEIRGEVLRLGNKSVTTGYQMIDTATAVTVATLEAVTAFFDLNARKALPLTDWMRTRCDAFLASRNG